MTIKRISDLVHGELVPGSIYRYHLGRTDSCGAVWTGDNWISANGERVSAKDYPGLWNGLAHTEYGNVTARQGPHPLAFYLPHSGWVEKHLEPGQVMLPDFGLSENQQTEPVDDGLTGWDDIFGPEDFTE